MLHSNPVWVRPSHNDTLLPSFLLTLAVIFATNLCSAQTFNLIWHSDTQWELEIDDDVSEPVSQLSYTYSYANTIDDLDPESLTVDLTGSWFNTDGEASATISVNTTEEIIYIDLSRPTNNPKSGYGLVASGGGSGVVIDDLITRRGRTLSEFKLWQAGDYCLLKFEATEAPTHLSLITLGGTQLQQWTFAPRTQAFKYSTAHLPAGYYIFVLENRTGVARAKMLIQ